MKGVARNLAAILFTSSPLARTESLTRFDLLGTNEK